jgi:hypothetical protein
MISCREATRLISESLDRRLTLRERISLRVHLFVCKICTRYRQQVLFIRETLRLYEAAEDCPAPVSLSPETRDRIKRLLDENQ